MRLTSSLVVSAILMVVSVITYADKHADPPFADGTAVLNAYQGLVEEHLMGVLRTARAIAASRDARSGQWEVAQPALEQFSNDLETDATVWFMLPDGSYYTTESDGLTEYNLKDRPYYPTLMASQDTVGELVISKATGQRSVIIATPVMENGEVIAAIGISLSVQLLSELVDKHTSLPEHMYFYALDPATKIALHRHADRLFKTPGEVGDEILGEEFEGVLANEQGVFDYSLHGQEISSVFRKSPTLGWYFFIAKTVE
jgi:hypothetical protein